MAWLSADWLVSLRIEYSTRFSAQSFVSELAEKAGKDHLKFYLNLLGKDREIDPTEINDDWNHGENPKLYPVDTSRLRKVLQTAAKNAG